MSHTIDCTGLSCPQPVILTKKECAHHNDITVIVDNSTARENIKRLAAKENYTFTITEESESKIIIHLTARDDKTKVHDNDINIQKSDTNGPLVYKISSQYMGSGDDELGSLLIRAFIHTVTELDTKPDYIILYNEGVKLVADNSPVIDDMKYLESEGVKILVCGTCTNFFEITDNITAGIISNMYDILDILNNAGHIVNP